MEENKDNFGDKIKEAMIYLADIYDKYSGSQAARKGAKAALTGEMPQEVPSGTDIAADQLGYSKEQKFKVSPISIASGALEVLGPLGSLPPLKALKTYVQAEEAVSEPVFTAGPAGVIGTGIEMVLDPVGNLLPVGAIAKGLSKGIKKGAKATGEVINTMTDSLPSLGVTEDGLMMPIKAAEEPKNLAFSKGKGRKLSGEYINLWDLKDDPNPIIQKYFKKDGGIKHSKFEEEKRKIEWEISMFKDRWLWPHQKEAIEGVPVEKWPMLLGTEFSETIAAQDLYKLIEAKRGLGKITELIKDKVRIERLEQDIDFELDKLQDLEKLSVELKDKSKLPNKDKILDRLKNAKTKEAAEKIIKRLRLSKKEQSKYFKEIAKIAWPTVKTIQALTIEERDKQK